MNDIITPGGLVILVTLISGIVAILAAFRKMRRENEADAQSRTDRLTAEISKHNDSVEKRLTVLETKTIDFVPRKEIEDKIEHQRSNFIAAQQTFVEVTRRHADEISALKVCVGKVEQKQDGMVENMVELKGLLRDMNGKLDKQQECLNSLSRRAA